MTAEWVTRSKALVQDAFGFMVSDFGYELRRAVSRWGGYRIEYSSERLALVIEWYPRDDLMVWLISTADGIVPERQPLWDGSVDHFDAYEVMSTLGAPSELAVHDLIDPPDERVAAIVAQEVRTNLATVLRGDQSVLQIVGTQIKARVAARRRAHFGDVVSLLLIADTHLPKRARDLPEIVWAAAETVDVVVHAGDWVSVGLLDELEQRSQRLLGVYGNNDGPALRERLPQVARAELGGVRLAVVHETGAATGREARCAATYPETDVLVFGHSHIPWDTTTSTGLRLLNPGSPTDRRRQPQCTFMTAVAAGGELRDVALHRLPPRTG